MDCCMILKMNKTVYKGRRVVNCVVGLFVKVSDFSSTFKYFYSRESGGDGVGEGKGQGKTCSWVGGG